MVQIDLGFMPLLGSGFDVDDYFMTATRFACSLTNINHFSCFCGGLPVVLGPVDLSVAH